MKNYYYDINQVKGVSLTIIYIEWISMREVSKRGERLENPNTGDTCHYKV